MSKDDRETPPALFYSLNKRYNFTLDACATHLNHKCPNYYTEQGLWVSDDTTLTPLAAGCCGLTGSWAGSRVWCNPPYSDIGSWVLKAWDSEAESVCMLVPATRTEQEWWQDGVEPYRSKSVIDLGWRAFEVSFLRGRQHFLKDGLPILNPKTGKRSSPKFGCALLLWS